MVDSSALSKGLVIPGYQHIQHSALIVRLEGSGNYSLLHLTKLAAPLRVNSTTTLSPTHNTPLMVCQTLKYFERQLPHFIRINKSSLINPLYIDKIVAVKSRFIDVYLVDGTILNGSRRRIVDITAKLALYQASVA